MMKREWNSVQAMPEEKNLRTHDAIFSKFVAELLTRF